MKRLCVSALLLAGCAAQGAPPKAEPEAIQSKTEAVLGADYADDGGCDAWEYCDLRVCIPEMPCPPGGVCRDRTRFDDAEGADIPDADPAGVSRTLTVSRPGATVAALSVSVSIDHTYRGDLRVVLQSPSGTEVVLHDRSGGSADGLTISRDVPEVVGEAAAGDWRLVVQDLARYDVGRIAGWTLRFDFADSPPPDDGRNVWTTVSLPGIESDHPYENRTDRTWDLGPWTGGTRARVHFETIDLERGYDFLEVLDAGSGRVLDRFTGRYDDLTTREYNTSALALHLTTDRSIVRYGFRADAVQVFGAGCLADEDCGAGRTCDDSIVCVRAPCFQQCVDATTGGEGDPCAGSADCAEELFCGTDGRCQRDGTCNEVADCSQEGNAWVHILCVGYAVCSDAGTCGYRCGEPLECVEGDVRDDGCNVCSCSGGRWLCTERFCPPIAGEGEACGGGTICAEGLVCDHGPADGAACGDDRPGICASQEPRYCRAVYSPVCTCNGQTFSNECERQGHGDWASAGRCELSVAIPDADPGGVQRTIHVPAPPGATSARVQVEIDHTWRGDLVVTVEAPDGSEHVLSNREGGSADDLDLDVTVDLGSGTALGAWTLSVRDEAAYDVGVLRFFNVQALP